MDSANGVQLPPLPVLTASQINSAKEPELQLWVDEINKVVSGKPIKLSHNVPALRMAIADFLGISLDNPLSTTASDNSAELSTYASASVNAKVDHALRVKHYQGLYNLGLEWKKKEECGERFLLLPNDDVAHQRTPEDLEHVQALTQLSSRPELAKVQ